MDRPRLAASHQQVEPAPGKPLTAALIRIGDSFIEDLRRNPHGTSIEVWRTAITSAGGDAESLMPAAAAIWRDAYRLTRHYAHNVVHEFANGIRQIGPAAQPLVDDCLTLLDGPGADLVRLTSWQFDGNGDTTMVAKAVIAAGSPDQIERGICTALTSMAGQDVVVSHDLQGRARELGEVLAERLPSLAADDRSALLAGLDRQAPVSDGGFRTGAAWALGSLLCAVGHDGPAATTWGDALCDLAYPPCGFESGQDFSTNAKTRMGFGDVGDAFRARSLVPRWVSWCASRQGAARRQIWAQSSAALVAIALTGRHPACTEVSSRDAQEQAARLVGQLAAETP
jgi:hypothetical protein